jgi:hypothetical protein
LWERFASVIGIDPYSCDTSVTTPNDSLGVVEVELLRKVNTYLGRKYSTPRLAGAWLRSYLGADVLAPRRGDRYGPDAEQEAFLRKKAVEIVDAIRAAGYDVIGDVDDLLPPDGPINWRHPDDVTPAELADAGAATIARMLDDLRRVTVDRNRLRDLVQQAKTDRRLSRSTVLRRAARRVPALAQAARRIRS